MTTIAVVKKNGYVAIAADTLTTLGDRKESSNYVLNSEKIIKYKTSFLAVTGWGTFQLALKNILVNNRKIFKFDSVENIYKSWLIIHSQLKENYFLQPVTDSTDPFENSHGDILIANPHGIFGISAYQYVQEFSKFYSYGSGGDYAIGAMFATYSDKAKSAEDTVKIGISAGAEFDDGSALPLTSYNIRLK